MSFFEIYILTRLMHIDVLANILAIGGGALAIIGFIALTIFHGDSSHSVQSLSEKAIPFYKKIMVCGIILCILGGVAHLFSIDSNTELAVILAVPVASEMMDSETIGDEVKEWNDIIQSAVVDLLEGEDMDEVLEGVSGKPE